MVIIQLINWNLKVDREATLKTYASVTSGSAEACGCTECNNYSINRESIFPLEFKLLLNQLGIDYTKEAEAWRMCKEKDGNHRYSGIFHFKGSFEGKDCFITTDGKNGTLSMTDIYNSFSIGFRVANDRTYFKEEDNLVQIEYEVSVPWTISKEFEP